MKELGFFMDHEGNVIRYGEWKEQYDKKNRHEIHEPSFQDEVEATSLFQRLNLQYNSEMGLYGKAITFALQGMVLMQNLTSQGESRFVMHVPMQLTEAQKVSFADLYPTLASFEKVRIVIPKSVSISPEDEITDLDSYYELQGIKRKGLKEEGLKKCEERKPGINYVEITKEQLLAFLFEGEIIGSGTYGIIKEIDSITLAKIYYKEMIDTFLAKDPSKLDEEIELRKRARDMSKSMQNAEELESLEQSKLKYLSEIGLVKGILMYKGYKVGVLLNYYRDYSKLSDVAKALSEDVLRVVMARIKEKLMEMMQHGILPRDIKEDNILVRLDDLDIAFIDLDDVETRFEEMDYILSHPGIADSCLEGYAKMEHRVCKR